MQSMGKNKYMGWLAIKKKCYFVSAADLDDSDEVSESSDKSSSLQHELLCDYGLPDSVLERAKINNILSAMKRVSLCYLKSSTDRLLIS